MRRVRRLRVVRIEGVAERGSTSPLRVLGDDGRVYLAKCGGQTLPDHFHEAAGAQLAPLVGVRVPEWVVLDFDALFGAAVGCEGVVSPAFVDAVKAAGGTAWGSSWLDAAVELDGDGNLFPLHEQIARLRWWDGAILNPDRTAPNSNALVEGRTLFAIDHAQAFPWTHDLGGEREAAIAALIDTGHIAAHRGIASIPPPDPPSPAAIRDALDEIPGEWWPRRLDRHDWVGHTVDRLTRLTRARR